jgi:glycosyltransferase involved in cell wall biosynthesis
MMKQLDVFGPYTGPTGYDHVVRGFVPNLSSMGVQINLENYGGWSNFNYFEHATMKAMERPHGGAPAIMNFCLPPQAHYIPHEFNILYSMFEASIVNEEWRKASSAMDMVIVPCEYSRQAFLATGVRQSALTVVPLGINPVEFNPDVEPMQFIDPDGERLIAKYPIRVMNMQELGPRKNIEGLVRAWIVATSSGVMNRSACLILKISAYSSGRYHKLAETLAAVRHELGISKNDHAPIFINCRLFQYDEVAKYMAVATHYITMSRGEGWDLPAMQAAALGKILIVPNHSSYRDWASDARVKMLRDGKEVKAAAEGPLKGIYGQATWTEPSVEEAISVLQSLPSTVFDDVRLARSFSQTVREKYSWKNVTQQLYSVLEDSVYNHTPGVPKIDVSREYISRQNTSVIAHWTQNLGQPCGIANYTSSLCTELAKIYKHVFAFGGDVRAHDLMCSINDYRVENIQYEYQFANHTRLAYMLQFLRERGVKSVVTMHTFSPHPHQENKIVFKYADAVIVHSEEVKRRMADEWYPVDKVHVMPMPVPPLMSAEEFEKVPRLKLEKTKPIIAFYGFLYFHKGAEKLVRAFAEMKKAGTDAILLMLACKPQNTNDDVAGRVQKIIDEYGLVGGKDFVWISDYVQNEREIVATLSQADLIVLPYDHYGSYGTSAAIGTCLAAGKPVATTDVCWFSHVPGDVAVKMIGGEGLSQSLKLQLEAATDPEMSATWSKKVKEFVEENQVSRVAQKHIDFYSKLAGFEFR